MTAKVSVVMATYNGQKFINEAIDSILNQTFTDFEFIIVDDGSTDATETIIKSYSDTRIMYVKKDVNSGISDSLNIGIDNAKGEYIARMDDDDVSLPNRFQLQVDFLNRNEHIIFCGSTVLDKASKTLTTPEKHDDILLKLLFSNPIFHPTVMLRKKVFEKHRYRTQFVPSEDYDLWSRLIFEGAFFQFQEPLLYCRIHQTSVTATRRHEQLANNISIAKFMYKNIGFDYLYKHETNLAAFASYNYKISSKRLRELTIWFKELKQANAKAKRFDIDIFNDTADRRLNRFLVSYFENRSVAKKIVPFLYLKTKYKRMIIKQYLDKLKP